MATYDIGAIRQYLLADSELSALVGTTRIYGHEIPDAVVNGWSGKVPSKTVLINDAGNANQDESRRPLNWSLKDVRCYGESPYESARLFDVVKQLLKQIDSETINVSGFEPLTIYSVIQVSGRFTTREPDTDWPVSMGSFNIMMGES